MSDEDREDLERQLQSLSSRAEASKRQEQEKQALRSWKRDEKQRRSEGKNPYYLKKCELALLRLLVPVVSQANIPHVRLCSPREGDDAGEEAARAQPRQAQAAQTRDAQRKEAGWQGEEEDAAPSCFCTVSRRPSVGQAGRCADWQRTRHLCSATGLHLAPWAVAVDLNTATGTRPPTTASLVQRFGDLLKEHVLRCPSCMVEDLRQRSIRLSTRSHAWWALFCYRFQCRRAFDGQDEIEHFLECL